MNPIEIIEIEHFQKPKQKIKRSFWFYVLAVIKFCVALPFLILIALGFLIFTFDWKLKKISSIVKFAIYSDKETRDKRVEELKKTYRYARTGSNK